MRTEWRTGTVAVGWLLLAPAMLAEPAAPAAAHTVNVDVTADRRPISPLIYGVAFASQAQLQDLNATLNRVGGTAFTSYNWAADALNTGEDYYFESLLQGPGTPGGWYDGFIDQTRAGDGLPMVTVPLIDWIAKLGPSNAPLSSFSVAKYGAQEDADPNWADAGNGILVGGAPVVGNDPTDASTPNSAAHQQGWIQHLATTWDVAVRGGVRYYMLDNEPSIWQQAHRDVQPVGAHDQDVLAKSLAYAAAIKDVDNAAFVLGPEEWGWSGFFYSGYDQQWWAAHGYQGTPPDYAARGPFSPWYLQQMAAHEAQTGRRLLNAFTLHHYPQGGEFCWQPGCGLDNATQLLRNRSTRELWDPDYVSESWINDTVRLLPRMREWVDAYYPGTLVGLTEYNWGAESHVNGATAQADILGILGREGADLGVRWEVPPTGSPAYKAFKLYRNYDGARGRFGDVSVRAVAPAPDTLAAFAAVRVHDGALTVMVIAKALSGSETLTLNVAGFVHGAAAQVWQLGAANTLQRLADVPVAAGTLTATLPAPSITLFVIPAAQPRVARGDFNADRQADILYRNTATGDVRAWFMNGVNRTGLAVTTPAGEGDPGWRIAGTNDFTGDRINDILWRHATTGELRVWAMNGTTRTGVLGTTPAAVPDLNWTIAGTGDFDGDGKADIVWRHAVSGKNVAWLMDGTTRLTGAFLNPDTVADLQWLIAGVADFDADGRNDLIWRHAVSGKVVVWLMDGLTRLTGAFTTPPSLGDPNWEMAGIGDFSRDGQPDLLWRHRVSGRNVVWFMNGLKRAFGTYTSPDGEPDTNWVVVGPR